MLGRETAGKSIIAKKLIPKLTTYSAFGINVKLLIGKMHCVYRMKECGAEYRVGRGKPPLHTRFKKGQSGNPRGPRAKNLPALLVEALGEPVILTTNGRRRQITKREAVIAQLV